MTLIQDLTRIENVKKILFYLMVVYPKMYYILDLGILFSICHKYSCKDAVCLKFEY